MLTCKDVTDRASAMIDGELGMYERFQMRFHMALCKNCGAFYQQMETTKELTWLSAAYDELPETQAQDGISAIFAQLQNEKQTGR